MTGLILKRILGALPNLLSVIVATFVVARALPGDPALYYAGPAANPDSIQQIRETLGLDAPLPVQFGVYVGDLVQGDLGMSLITGRPVLRDLVERLPASLELTLCALLIATLVALPLGVMAAVRPNSIVDHLCRGTVTLAAALPSFFIGLLMIYVFYFLLGWAPSPLGRLEIFYSPPSPVTGFYTVDALLAGDWGLLRAAAAQLVLPAVSLALFAMAPLARMSRAALLAVLSSEFIRSARAAGLAPRTVLIRYGLRNALIPVVNVMGMVFSFLLGANVLIEQVFGWPGVGRYAVEAVLASDYAAVQGFVLTMAILYLLLNLGVDILNTLIDPRIRFEG